MPPAMPVSRRDLEVAIRDLLAEVLERPATDLQPATRFDDDLGVDSLKMIEVAIELETRFDFAMPDLDTLGDVQVRTVGDLIAFVERCLEDARR